MKRFFDVLISLAGLVLLAPLFLVIAAGIALGSRRPILFRQERIGRHFRPFTLYKFRTMVTGSEAGPPVTAQGDPRVTSIGRLLRKTKLDELPQLVNVLKGDMSLVGPRPEVRKYVELFRVEYEEVLSVRPGITDHAAIAYRDEEALLKQYPDPEMGYIQAVLPAKIELYRRYVRERKMFTDVEILWATLWRLAGG